MHAAQLHIVCGAAKAYLDERRAGQRGDVEHTAPARDPLEGTPYGGVRHLGHDPDIGSNLADPQCCFECVDFLHLGTYHRGRMRQTGIDERVPEVRTAL